LPLAVSTVCLVIGWSWGAVLDDVAIVMSTARLFCGFIWFGTIFAEALVMKPAIIARIRRRVAGIPHRKSRIGGSLAGEWLDGQS
jgi:hypothetical protein